MDKPPKPGSKRTLPLEFINLGMPIAVGGKASGLQDILATVEASGGIDSYIGNARPGAALGFRKNLYLYGGLLLEDPDNQKKELGKKALNTLFSNPENTDDPKKIHFPFLKEIGDLGPYLYENAYESIHSNEYFSKLQTVLSNLEGPQQALMVAEDVITFTKLDIQGKDGGNPKLTEEQLDNRAVYYTIDAIHGVMRNDQEKFDPSLWGKVIVGLGNRYPKEERRYIKWDFIKEKTEEVHDHSLSDVTLGHYATRLSGPPVLYTSQAANEVVTELLQLHSEDLNRHIFTFAGLSLNHEQSIRYIEEALEGSDATLHAAALKTLSSSSTVSRLETIKRQDDTLIDSNRIDGLFGKVLRSFDEGVRLNALNKINTWYEVSPTYIIQEINRLSSSGLPEMERKYITSSLLNIIYDADRKYLKDGEGEPSPKLVKLIGELRSAIQILFDDAATSEWQQAGLSKIVPKIKKLL